MSFLLYYMPVTIIPVLDRSLQALSFFLLYSYVHGARLLFVIFIL
jgi:hypothetical protein